MRMLGFKLLVCERGAGLSAVFGTSWSAPFVVEVSLAGGAPFEGSFSANVKR